MGYLLHRYSSAIGEAERRSVDPFDGVAKLPTAIEQVADTSLWEIKVLLRHHLPAVATHAKLFLRPFFKPTARKMDPDVFLDQSAEKAFKQALRSGERQATKWKTRGDKCPVAFKVEDNDLADRVVGLAASLSTDQR